MFLIIKRFTNYSFFKGRNDFKRKIKREIPEVEAGILEIVNVAREAGLRSKVSVKKFTKMKTLKELMKLDL